MKKSKLLRIKKLTITEEMMDMAKKEKPEYSTRYGFSNITYRYGRYLVACVIDGILKVSIFCTEAMILGSKQPIYDIFIDKEKEDFVTYDFLHDCWSNAKLDRLVWPRYTQDYGGYTDEEGRDCILQYLESESQRGNHQNLQFSCENEPYSAILAYQNYLREKHLYERDQMEMEPWQKKMEQVPEVPKDWNRWVSKVGITQNYIFYEYRRGGSKSGYCTWCERTVPISREKHNKYGRCRCCGHEIQYKSVGRMSKLLETNDTAYLIQRCKDGFVVREFQIQQNFLKSSYQKPTMHCWERRRFLYNDRMVRREFYYGTYKRRLEGWIEGPLKRIDSSGYAYYEPFNRGKVYGRTMMSLSKKELKYTGFAEMRRALKYICPVEYIEFWKRYPYVEQLAKAGLTRIVKELLNGEKINGFNTERELRKKLEIDRFRLGRLREQNGGSIYLKWLQYEKAADKVIGDDVLRWFEKWYIRPIDIDFISDRMSELQVKNYLERQRKESKEEVKDLISTWKDYLTMAKRAKMDIQDPIVYRVKNMVKRHDEMVKLVEDKGMVLKAAEIAESFPLVDQTCLSLKEKYEFEDDEYQLIAPTGIEEILRDAKELHHCVDKNETYFDRINARETYILMLRKKPAIDKPFYTLEIEPDGTIRQARTEFNRQLEDIELAKPFLYQWQKQLRKKLVKEDYKLAEKSRELRKTELGILRQKKVKINGGDYQGRLLADVLAEDLMENMAVENQVA